MKVPDKAIKTVDFEPLGRRGQCGGGDSILACARRLNIGISSVCGGTGTCGKCRVRVLSGSVSGITAREEAALSAAEIKAGWRLGCQARPESDVKLDVPPTSMTTSQRIQLECLDTKVPVQPVVKAYAVKITPEQSDQRGDADFLLDELNRQHGLHCDKLEFETLRAWPSLLEQPVLQVAVRGNQVVSVAQHPSPLVGFAADLGTTKIAAYLIDLTDGRTLAAKGAMNPQIDYGEDVISRIAIALRKPEAAIALRERLVDVINKLAAGLCVEAGLKPSDIIEAVFVANTAVHHLFLGLPVNHLAVNPFVPTVSQAVEFKARDLGLRFSPSAYSYVLPNIGGFVGADHVAMLLATGAIEAEEPGIFIDIGTNTEVSLRYKGQIIAASCASGPALEGGHINNGMRAAPGAIERVLISANKVEFLTIENAPPVGICGSGILDTVAQMFLAGVIDASGRMNSNHPRVRTTDAYREFVLVEGDKSKPAITFTQHDVRQVQLGKAAIRTGIEMLINIAGCPQDEIKQVIVAGAFGSYIDINSAIDAGMVPALPLERYRQVGNAVGTGAKLGLISLAERAKANSIAARTRHIELAALPDFNSTLLKAMRLGRYEL